MTEHSESNAPLSAAFKSTQTLCLLHTCKRYLGDIRRNYKLKSFILCSQCVTCNDTLNEGLEEMHFTEE